MKVHLNDVRISYTQNLFVPGVPKGSQPGAEAKYSSSFVFAKEHPAVKQIAEAVVAVAKAKWGEELVDDGAGGKQPKYQVVLRTLKASDRLPVHDGDAKESEGYRGNLYMNASNKLRPLVIDELKQPVDAASGKIYSGCFVNAVVEIWAMDNAFGKRVNASLLGVQKLRDGDRLSGGSVASADDFQPVKPAGGAAVATDAASLF